MCFHFFLARILKIAVCDTLNMSAIFCCVIESPMRRIANTSASFNFADGFFRPFWSPPLFFFRMSRILSVWLPMKRWPGFTHNPLSHLCKTCIPFGIFPLNSSNDTRYAPRDPAALLINIVPHPLFPEPNQSQQLPRCGTCAGMGPSIFTLFQNLTASAVTFLFLCTAGFVSYTVENLKILITSTSDVDNITLWGSK